MTDTIGRIKVRFDLATAILRLQLHNKRRYTYADIASRTTLHENTVQRLASKGADRVDVETLSELVTFFRSEGLADFAVGDLFVMEQAA